MCWRLALPPGPAEPCVGVGVHTVKRGDRPARRAQGFTSHQLNTKNGRAEVACQRHHDGSLRTRAPPSPAHAQPRSSAGASAAQIRCEMSPRRGFQGGERTWGHTEQMAAGRSRAGLSSVPVGTRRQGKEVVERLPEHLPCQPPRRHHLLGAHGGWAATNTTQPISLRLSEEGLVQGPSSVRRSWDHSVRAQLFPSPPFPRRPRPAAAPPSPQPSVNHQRRR